MTTATVLEQAAVELASRGYHVFPCKPGQKTPLTAHGFKDATRDERTILHAWDRTPTANIGIACQASGIVVLDIDTKHGADPNLILKDKELQGAAIVQTGTAPPPDPAHPDSLEGRRGVQVYFRGSMRTGDTNLPGVEIRGNGAYVVAPPSLHPSGVNYGPSLPMPASTLLEIPDWVRDIIPDDRTNGPAAQVEEIITAGARNTKLVSIAGTMRRRGLDATEIAGALHSVNKRRCRPPLPPDEVEAIAKSVARYKPADTVNGHPKFKPLAKDAQGAARTLSDLLSLQSVGMHITAARVYGKGSTASLEIDISNGETLTFATLREMMRPQTLIAEVAACTGTAPVLKQIDCAHALTLARQVATLVEVDSENDIAREWGRDFLDLADALDLDINDQAQRWRAFDHLAARDPWTRHHDPSSSGPQLPLVIRHLDGTRYVRTLWFERYVKTRDSSVSRTSIGARMGRVGWHRRGRHGDIKATAPGRPEYRIWPFWIVPDGWEDVLEAAA